MNFSRVFRENNPRTYREIEEKHIKQALKKCGYPEWTLKNRKKREMKQSDENMPIVTIPYI